GGFMLAIGGKTIGKTVYGQWTGLGDDQLYGGRDLPAHTDYRMVFAEALQAMFGFDGMKLGMFPGYTAHSPPLDFLQGA
ncbi:MAG: twin-arginine translocation pathway signal, partial [Planctomycetes bacterium]|nr:twin-arginine translocation pathway signal [Planctomycetota bacterium]